VHGTLELGARPPDKGGEQELDGYSIDSRTLSQGDLFFALVGPRVDGHDFVKDAVARGAAAVVVSRGGRSRFPEAPAIVRVKDTTVVLWAACASIAESTATRASTSATAIRIFTGPPAPSAAGGAATESWSRSRESSLSIEHHSRSRRSRVAAGATAAAWIPASSASAGAG